MAIKDFIKTDSIEIQFFLFKKCVFYFIKKNYFNSVAIQKSVHIVIVITSISA